MTKIKQGSTSLSPTLTESWNISITHTIDDRTEYLVFLGQVNLAEKTILIILAIFTILGPVVRKPISLILG
jgi:hypothetical protein